MDLNIEWDRMYTDKMECEYYTYNAYEFVQSYFEIGEVHWIGLFSDENLVGLFSSVSDAYAQYEKFATPRVVTFHTKKIDPSFVDDAYNKEFLCKEVDSIMANHTGHGSNGIGWIEMMFLYIMLNPDLIARDPSFRKAVEDKLETFRKTLTDSLLTKYHKYHYSNIILDLMPKFLEDIKHHVRYM